MGIRKEIYALGTNCIIYIDIDKKEIISEVINIIYRYQNLWSYYIDNSDIDLINKSSGIKEVEINKETMLLLKRISDYYDQSKGYFDITIKPIIKALGIENNSVNIDDMKLKECSDLIGFKSLRIDGKNNKVILEKNNQEIDLGSIAKGTIANLVYDYLNNMNISYILDLGGQVSIFNNKDTYIGIQDPFSDRYDYCVKIKMNNEHITTSGIYERYNKNLGETYNHLINPKTKESISNSIYSVSVIYNNAEIAEFLSTSIIVMGIDKYKELLKLYKDAKVIIIDKNKKIYVSSNLEGKLAITNSIYKLEIIKEVQ